MKILNLRNLSMTKCVLDKNIARNFEGWTRETIKKN